MHVCRNMLCGLSKLSSDQINAAAELYTTNAAYMAAAFYEGTDVILPRPLLKASNPSCCCTSMMCT